MFFEIILKKYYEHKFVSTKTITVDYSLSISMKR